MKRKQNRLGGFVIDITVIAVLGLCVNSAYSKTEPLKNSRLRPTLAPPYQQKVKATEYLYQQYEKIEKMYRRVKDKSIRWYYDNIWSNQQGGGIPC